MKQPVASSGEPLEVLTGAFDCALSRPLGESGDLSFSQLPSGRLFHSTSDSYVDSHGEDIIPFSVLAPQGPDPGGIAGPLLCN